MNNKKAANLKCIMIVQQLDIKLWHGWNPQFIEYADNGNLTPLLEEVVNRFNKSGCEVSDAYGIIHDKDEITVWNQEQMKDITELKTKHVHLLLKFSKGNTINILSNTVGLEPQYLEKAKSGRYGYDNLLSYLVHVKDQEKYQYNPEEVITVVGEPYLSIYNRRMSTWIKGRATKEAKEANLGVDHLVAEILDGKLSKDQILLTNEYYKIYALNRRSVEDAFNAYNERKGLLTINDLKLGRFQKTIIFVTGYAGSGKTLLSNRIIEEIKLIAQTKNNERWEHCVTASTNALDNYLGEEILNLDDARGSSLTASDWLKLLDNYNMSHISARYKNKLGVAKVIIITSTKEPISFFSESKENVNEDVSQFIRRINLLIHVNNNSTTTISKSRKEVISIPQPFNMPQKEGIRYSFVEENTYDLDETLHKVLNTIKENMKWNDTNEHK